MSWAPLPMAFDEAAPAEDADDEQPPMGEPGERGFSARQRAVPRSREEADAAPANGTAAPAEPAADPVEPAAKAQKAKKAPDAVKLLRKMKKASHPEHEHLEFSVAEGVDRIWCNACGHSFGTKANVRDHHWNCTGHKTGSRRSERRWRMPPPTS